MDMDMDKDMTLKKTIGEWEHSNCIHDTQCWENTTSFSQSSSLIITDCCSQLSCQPTTTLIFQSVVLLREGGEKEEWLGLCFTVTRGLLPCPVKIPCSSRFVKVLLVTILIRFPKRLGGTWTRKKIYRLTNGTLFVYEFAQSDHNPVLESMGKILFISSLLFGGKTSTWNNGKWSYCIQV